MAFISNVDMAFEVINPDNSDILYKYVLLRISGEPRVAITHRNVENWEDLRTFLKNTYTEKRTLDFHAMQLFRARQGKNESISDWIQNIQRLSSKFREAALQDCNDDERTGIVALADKLRNICFVQGISSHRIQTIVRSRNGSDPDRLFLLSLLDDFKKIPHERKADVKISMINSIRSASLVQRSAPPPPHQYRNNYTSHSVYATASLQPLHVDPIHPQNVTISTPSTSRQSANNPISSLNGSSPLCAKNITKNIKDIR